MRISILLLFLLVAAIGQSCQSQLWVQNQDLAGKSAAPTVTPSEQKYDKQKFDEHYSRGITIWSTGKIPDDLPKAIEEFRKASEYDSQNTTAFGWMIKLYAYSKDYEQIENCYRQILKRTPDDLNAQWGLTYVLIWDLRRYEEGLKEAQIAKEKKATYAWLIDEAFGKAYEGMGDIPTAIKHYKQYLRDVNDRDSTLYKDMKKKIVELEKKNPNSNTNN